MWMRAVERPQFGERRLQAAAEAPERGGLFLHNLVLQDVGGRSESAKARHFGFPAATDIMLAGARAQSRRRFGSLTRRRACPGDCPLPTLPASTCKREVGRGRKIIRGGGTSPATRGAAR